MFCGFVFNFANPLQLSVQKLNKTEENEDSSPIKDEVKAVQPHKSELRLMAVLASLKSKLQLKREACVFAREVWKCIISKQGKP